MCASEHPECVCAECGARRQTASSRPGAVPSGGGAGSGRQGALEGPGDGGGHAGKGRKTGRLHGIRITDNHCITSDPTQCSELGDVQISLSYSSSLQRLSVVVLRARGLQLLSDAGAFSKSTSM